METDMAVDGEIEIEFGSQLGEVRVVRAGEQWRCQVRLLGQEQEVGGTVEGDGNRSSAYDCFEYLSHLLKHDCVFLGDAGDDAEEPGPAIEGAEAPRAEAGAAAGVEEGEAASEPPKHGLTRRKHGS
jgi:hypothetical protein